MGFIGVPELLEAPLPIPYFHQVFRKIRDRRREHQREGFISVLFTQNAQLDQAPARLALAGGSADSCVRRVRL